MPYIGSVPAVEPKHTRCLKPIIWNWSRAGKLWECGKCKKRWSIQKIEDKHGYEAKYWREETKEKAGEKR